MLLPKRLVAFAGASLTLLISGGAAEAGIGHPSPWEFGLQGAATPVMAEIWFNDFLLWIIGAITLLVLGLLVAVIVRFNARAHPVPSRTTHNTALEVLWTVIPVLILVVIAVPSFRLLFYELTVPKPDLTVKAIGHQWYWSYDYPDAKFEFTSMVVPDDKLKSGEPRLLAVDNELVVPVNKVVKVLVTGTDVIHSWAVPSFGVKIDAIPGRMNDTWFKATRIGTYYGQCSQLCGRNHAFMPIAVRVVSEKDYQAWLTQAKKKFASADPAAKPTKVAKAQTQ